MRAAARATDAMTSALAGRARVRGQALVEFIVSASVLLLLIMGTIQFAMIYQAKIRLNYAAFETARAGSVAKAIELIAEAGRQGVQLLAFPETWIPRRRAWCLSNRNSVRAPSDSIFQAGLISP